SRAMLSPRTIVVRIHLGIIVSCEVHRGWIFRSFFPAAITFGSQNTTHGPASSRYPPCRRGREPRGRRHATEASTPRRLRVLHQRKIHSVPAALSSSILDAPRILQQEVLQCSRRRLSYAFGVDSIASLSLLSSSPWSPGPSWPTGSRPPARPRSTRIPA